MADNGYLATQFRVHGVVMSRANVKVTLDEEPTDAEIAVLEVELTGEKGNGSLTLRFRGPQVDEARALFKQGETVTATWE